MNEKELIWHFLMAFVSCSFITILSVSSIITGCGKKKEKLVESVCSKRTTQLQIPTSNIISAAPKDASKAPVEPKVSYLTTNLIERKLMNFEISERKPEEKKPDEAPKEEKKEKIIKEDEKKIEEKKPEEEGSKANHKSVSIFLFLKFNYRIFWKCQKHKNYYLFI